MNKEASICATVVERLRSEGWIVACEVPIYHRHVDAVALKDGILMAIEAKTSLTKKVMRQIFSSISAVDLSLIVIGAVPRVGHRIEWCQRMEVGLWIVKGSEITEMLAPIMKYANGYKDSVIKSVLRCASSDTVGGLPNQKGVGVAQDVQRRVDEYRALHPKATWKEIYDHVPSHYNNYKNMYSALRSNAERLAFRARLGCGDIQSGIGKRRKI